MQHPPKLALIADDLTGALDAVAAFANAGLRCVVATGPAHVQAALDEHPEVIAISTNTRGLSAAQAAEVVAKVAHQAKGIRLVFKKIDSRLKGPIAAEVTALVQVLGHRLALLCPAIPQMGRLVINGHLQGFGVDGAIALAPILAGVAGLSVTSPDATSDDDIDAMLATAPENALLIGARGLSAGVARRMADGAALPLARALPQPMAFVIGSRDPITLAQVAHLRQSQPLARFVAAPNGVAAATGTAPRVTILQATPGDAAVPPETVAQDLAASCAHGLGAPACLVLTGGDTAAAVLADKGIGLLEVMGEVLPGMPLCKPLGFANGPLIVTKSGGFGAEDALSVLAGFIPDTQAAG